MARRESHYQHERRESIGDEVAEHKKIVSVQYPNKRAEDFIRHGKC